MLHDLTTDTREGYGAVVLRLRFCMVDNFDFSKFAYQTT